VQEAIDAKQIAEKEEEERLEAKRVLEQAQKLNENQE